MTNITFITLDGLVDAYINLDAVCIEYTNNESIFRKDIISFYTYENEELDINKTFRANGVQVNDIIEMRRRLSLLGLLTAWMDILIR